MATPIITSGSGQTLVSTVLNQVKTDLPGLLLVFGGLVAISIVLALIDMAAETRWLDEYGKRWRK